ncbi:HAD family hydrolase [Mariniluteicoccus flavus]
MTSGATDLGTLSGAIFDAVIFDMDGTLLDSTPAVVRSWTQWAVEHDLTAEQMAGYHGVPAASIVADLIDEPRRAAAVERIHALELADVADVVPLPGSVEAVAALPADRVAIATSCTRPLALARLEASGFAAPGVVVTVDDVERGKPAPDPFLLAAERLGHDPARCLVVEDAPKGIEGAKAAGCATLAVTTTTPTDQLDADAVVGDLSDVRFEAADGGVRVVRA